MKYSVFATILVAGAALGSAANAQTANTSPELIKTCEGCHGPKGNSTNPTTPRLNSQQSAYIVNRLRELTNLTTQSPHASESMSGIAHMQDSLRAQIGDYFSRQAPTPAQPQFGKLASIGAQIFMNGNLADNIQPCQTCHGANAEGRGAAPRLAGQHREYLKTELWNLNFALRESNVMHPTADKLTGDQIDALVAYLGAD